MNEPSHKSLKNTQLVMLTLQSLMLTNSMHRMPLQRQPDRRRRTQTDRTLHRQTQADRQTNSNKPNVTIMRRISHHSAVHRSVWFRERLIVILTPPPTSSHWSVHLFHALHLNPPHIRTHTLALINYRP